MSYVFMSAKKVGGRVHTYTRVGNKYLGKVLPKRTLRRDEFVDKFGIVRRRK